MAIRLFNLSKWWLLEGGAAYRFDNPKQRVVTLEVNASERCEIYVRQEGADPEAEEDIEAGRAARVELKASGLDQPQLLGVFEGRETFEFAVEGPFEVQTTVDTWLYSIDGQPSHSVIEDPVIFTRVANRRERNRHLEIIEFKMRENQRRFMEAVGSELERRTEALKQGFESYAAERRQKPTTAITGKEVPAQAPSGQSDAGRTPDGGVSQPPAEGSSSEAAGGGKGKRKADTEPVKR